MLCTLLHCLLLLFLSSKWTVNGKLRIGFFSVRDVEVNEELTFDYKFERFGWVALDRLTKSEIAKKNSFPQNWLCTSDLLRISTYVPNFHAKFFFLFLVVKKINHYTLSLVGCSDVAQKCYCGSANCRGYLGQTKQTPATLKVVTLDRELGSPRSPSSSRRRPRQRIQSDADSAVSPETFNSV